MPKSKRKIVTTSEIATRSKITVASSTHTCGECRLLELACARQGKKSKHMACVDFEPFQDCFEDCPFQSMFQDESGVYICSLSRNNDPVLLSRPQRTEECQALVKFIQLVQGLKR